MSRYPPTYLQQGSYAASVDRRTLGMQYPNPATAGAAVTVSSGMTVQVAVGSCAVPTANNTGTAVCAWDATELVTLAAAPGSGTNRYDLVVCQLRGNDVDGGTNNDFLFQNVTGTAAATPTVPATPANAVALAQIYVPGASASVTAGNIVDVRPAGGSAGDYGGRLAYTSTTTNQAFSTTESVTALVTPAVWIPSATRLIRVEAYARQANGASGDACIAKIREGSTTAGTLIQDGIFVMASGGPQIGTSGSVLFGRTYAPGLGLKQWCLTVQGASNIGNLIAGTGSPIWLEVLDVGP